MFLFCIGILKVLYRIIRVEADLFSCVLLWLVLFLYVTVKFRIEARSCIQATLLVETRGFYSKFYGIHNENFAVAF